MPSEDPDREVAEGVNLAKRAFVGWRRPRPPVCRRGALSPSTPQLATLAFSAKQPPFLLTILVLIRAPLFNIIKE